MSPIRLINGYLLISVMEVGGKMNRYEFWRRVERTVYARVKNRTTSINVEDLEFEILDAVEDEIEKLISSFIEHLRLNLDIPFEYQLKINPYGWSEKVEERIKSTVEFRDVFNEVRRKSIGDVLKMLEEGEISLSLASEITGLTTEEIIDEAKKRNIKIFEVDLDDLK